MKTDSDKKYENYEFDTKKNDIDFYSNTEFSIDVNKIQNEGRKASGKRPLKILTPQFNDKEKLNSGSDLDFLNTYKNNKEKEKDTKLVRDEIQTQTKKDKKLKFMEKITKINENFKKNVTNSNSSESKNKNKLSESFLNSSNFLKISEKNNKRMSWQNPIDFNTENNLTNNSFEKSYIKINEEGKQALVIPPGDSVLNISLADNNYTYIEESVKYENEKLQENERKNLTENNKPAYKFMKQGYFTPIIETDEEHNYLQKKRFKPKNNEMNVHQDSYLDLSLINNSKIFEEYESLNNEVKENENLEIDEANENPSIILPESNVKENKIISSDQKNLNEFTENKEEVDHFELDEKEEDHLNNEKIQEDEIKKEIITEEISKNEQKEQIEKEENEQKEQIEKEEFEEVNHEIIKEEEKENEIEIEEIEIEEEQEKEKEKEVNDYIYYEFQEDLKEKMKIKELSLKNILGVNLINSWKKNSVDEFNKLKLGIEKHQYFKYKVYLDGKKNDLLERCKNLSFLEGLNIYDEHVNNINILTEKIDFWKIDDLLINMEKLDEKQNIEYKNLKEKFFEELNKKENKNFEKKVNDITHNEVLKNKMGIQNDNEKIDSIDIFDKRSSYVFSNSNSISFENSFSSARKLTGIFVQRESIKDGNSFYRMFMFSLFENLILYKNMKLLAKIFLNIFFVYKDLKESNKNNEFNQKFIFNRIDIVRCIILFNFIINYMRMEDYQKAYDCLLKAFNMPCGSFDKLICGYLRLNILLFYKEINFEDLEPELINIELTSILFNVDIELYIFDGVINKENPIPLNYGKLNFKGKVRKENENKKTEGIISLFYNLDSYSKFYRYENFQRFKYIFSDLVKEEDIPKIMVEEAENECRKCREKDIIEKKRVLFLSKKLICCYRCLEENCKIYLKERLNSYLKDGCLSREYYCRSIEFEDFLKVEDCEYIQIFGKSFWYEIKNDFLKNCLFCNKINVEKNIFVLNQSETYCGDCILKEVKLKTNNLIILNEYEKRNPSIYIKEGNKNFHFKLEEAIEVMNLRTESRLEESRKRLIDHIKSFCCLCEHEKILNSKEALIFTSKNANLVGDDRLIHHYLCETCVEQFLDTPEKTENVKMENGRIRTANFYLIKLKCQYCKEEHSMNYLKYIENNKDNNSKCCLIF